ncbi:MAG: 5'/3'-nucleotidase SurE [Treponema sp.]|jgi:5'-nucleotidase|nr:5'/3'-nucleotidase SurE [Treponema sp.]
MNIVMTNDDGIDFEWFMRFVRAMQDMGKTRGHTIYVIAPEGDRSGFSHYITFIGGPIRLKKREENIWACSGAPADCVMMAAMGALPFTVDLVVSGINRGANLGTDIVYSGTAAAARQASLHHIPAVAYSLAGETKPLYWEKAVEYAVTHIEEFAALWQEDIFINVNLPNIPSGAVGSEITFPARRIYEADSIEVFDAPDRKRYCFMNAGAVETVPEAGSDYDAVSRNMASVSPVFIHPVVANDICTGAPEHAGVTFRPRN